MIFKLINKRRLFHAKGQSPQIQSKGMKRGEAPLENNLPSPLPKGRGIKGEGLVNNLQSNMEYQTT